MAACVPVEVEIKVSALPGEELRDDLVLALADTRLGLLGTPQSLVLEAHYHDDNEGLLRGLGWALRARQEGDVLIATAKGPAQDQDGVPARPEVNVVIKSLPLADEALPAALATTLQRAGLSLDYWPGAQWVTRVQRTFVDLRLPGGGRAELAIDHGRVHSDTKSHPIVEFELELREGEAHELLKGAAILSEGLAVRPGGRSKAARGLQLLGRLRPPEFRKEASLLGLWEQTCELEEWLREGAWQLRDDYVSVATSLLKELNIGKPNYLGGEVSQLQSSLDSTAHAKLLWRIFSRVHQGVAAR